jgi:hypothetical protein
VGETMKWKIVDRTEQETMMNIDYYEKTISIYTSRKQVGERLYKKFGKPTYSDTQNGLTTSVTYVRNLFDKDVSKFFSKMLLIGSFRDNNSQNDELVEEDTNDSKE